MDKAELSKMLEAKVLEKLQAGYQITTYAMDAASRDRLKQGFKPQGHPPQHDENTHPIWDGYVKQLEDGSYVSEQQKSEIATAPADLKKQPEGQTCSSPGLWRVRRH